MTNVCDSLLFVPAHAEFRSVSLVRNDCFCFQFPPTPSPPPSEKWSSLFPLPALSTRAVRSCGNLSRVTRAAASAREDAHPPSPSVPPSRRRLVHFSALSPRTRALALQIRTAGSTADFPHGGIPDPLSRFFVVIDRSDRRVIQDDSSRIGWLGSADRLNSRSGSAVSRVRLIEYPAFDLVRIS